MNAAQVKPGMAVVYQAALQTSSSGASGSWSLAWDCSASPRNYNYKRYYQPGTGRYLGVDPLRDSHPYAYTANNPIRRFDPNGLSWTEWDLNVIAGVIDSLTFGISRAAREALEFYVGESGIFGDQGYRDFVNTDCASYQQGYFGASVILAASGLYGIGKGGVGLINWLRGGGLKKMAGVINRVGSSGRLLGLEFGKLGTVVRTPSIKVTSKDPHFLLRAAERGVSEGQVAKTLKNPAVVLEQHNGYLFLADDAAVVVNKQGKLITTYGQKEYDPLIKAILEFAQ